LGIIESKLFAYSNGYVISDSIEPGKGYWVKASQSGKFILSVPSATINVRRDSSGFLDSLNTLTLADSSRRKSTLYFTARKLEETQLRHYEIPPIPPPAVFDVRFETQRIVASIGHANNVVQEPRILIQSATYPLTLSWKIVDDRSTYVLVENFLGEPIMTHEIAGEGNLEITNPSVTLFILTQEELSQTLPKEFSVKQNFPNPFNPSTVIEFDLPVPSVVSLRVYTVMGQEVRALLKEQYFPGGHYSSQLDAGNLSTGVYFYRFTAKPVNEQRVVQSINKMILLK
jgi:hypothetical protein